MDDRTKAKIAMVVTPIVILLVFLINKTESKRCDPIRERTMFGMNRLFSENSIKQIVLKNGREPFDDQLDSLVITDTETLEEIRKIILDRAYISVTKYSTQWEVNLIITVDTGNEFNIVLKKSNNENKADYVYKIYFNDECSASQGYGSKDLGPKIAELIKNRPGSANK